MTKKQPKTSKIPIFSTELTHFYNNYYYQLRFKLHDTLYIYDIENYHINGVYMMKTCKNTTKRRIDQWQIQRKTTI